MFKVRIIINSHYIVSRGITGIDFGACDSNDVEIDIQSETFSD